MPAIPLDITKAQRLVDAPHKADPIKNTIVANNNAFFLPNASEIRPSMEYENKLMLSQADTPNNIKKNTYTKAEVPCNSTSKQ